MIVDLRTISGDYRKIAFELEPDWWQPEDPNDPVIGPEGPVPVSVQLTRLGGKFLLEGRATGTIKVCCDRCLEPYLLPIDARFRMFMVLPPENPEEEVELSEEDLSVDFVTTDEIDLADVVREQIYLALPMKFLCREDCQGICPQCGANRNEELCECREDKAHPAFAKLKTIKIQGD